jgi:Icc-related predicted phosphoesterase
MLLEKPMKIRVWSDLHVDGAALNFNDECLDEVLILAGDTANSLLAAVEFVSGIALKFKHVLFVPGNHEYYRGTIVSEFRAGFESLMKERGIENVTFLDGNIHQIDDVTFIGATLWTDFDKRNYQVEFAAKRGINDFRLMKIAKDVNVSPEWMAKQSRQDLDFIREACRTMTGKKVVITHFPPLRKFQHPKWGTLKENPLNGYFMSEYSHEIMDLEFDYWICGHTHDGSNFEEWGKKFIANPRGYCYRGTTENAQWNQNLVIEL